MQAICAGMLQPTSGDALRGSTLRLMHVDPPWGTDRSVAKVKALLNQFLHLIVLVLLPSSSSVSFVHTTSESESPGAICH